MKRIRRLTRKRRCPRRCCWLYRRNCDDDSTRVVPCNLTSGPLSVPAALQRTRPTTTAVRRKGHGRRNDSGNVIRSLRSSSGEPSKQRWCPSFLCCRRRRCRVGHRRGLFILSAKESSHRSWVRRLIKYIDLNRSKKKPRGGRVSWGNEKNSPQFGKSNSGET